MAGASHEEAVALLTSSYPSVTLVVTRERVLEKRMTPLSKHREDSLINKRIAEKELIQDAMIRASAEVKLSNVLCSNICLLNSYIIIISRLIFSNCYHNIFQWFSLILAGYESR